jgi:hypothetical protein
MKRYSERDLAFYADGIEGDLVLGQPNESGLVDLLLTKEFESARQDIASRSRTQTGDWRSHPKIGGDLELLEGEPNTRATGMAGVSQLMETLTYDGRFRSQDLQIRPVPVSLEQIDFYVMLDTGEELPVVQVQPLNL